MAHKITLFLDPALTQPVAPESLNASAELNIKDVRVYVPGHGECVLIETDLLDQSGQPIYEVTPKK